jgi:predicted transcriptional regulator
MHTKGIAGPAVEQDRETDRAILDLLLIDAHAPLSVEEIAREIGDDNDARDGLARLTRAGLVHRLESFVWATRSAACAAALHA